MDWEQDRKVRMGGRGWLQCDRESKAGMERWIGNETGNEASTERGGLGTKQEE